MEKGRKRRLRAVGPPKAQPLEGHVLLEFRERAGLHRKQADPQVPFQQTTGSLFLVRLGF